MKPTAQMHWEQRYCCDCALSLPHMIKVREAAGSASRNWGNLNDTHMMTALAAVAQTADTKTMSIYIYLSVLCRSAFGTLRFKNEQNTWRTFDSMDEGSEVRPGPVFSSYWVDLQTFIKRDLVSLLKSIGLDMEDESWIVIGSLCQSALLMIIHIMVQWF